MEEKVDMKTLSVVLAVYNEEKNLPVCLNSVKDIADEIVIVDGGSGDKTVAMAKQYHAKVVITDNPQIFHVNKQKAIDMASKDWILQLDADEQVTPVLAKEITERINDTNSDTNGYWIPRKNWFLGRFLMKGGQYPDYTLRLYKKGKGRLPQKDVHEQAIVAGKTEKLKNPLVHMADPSFARYLKRYSRYTDLLAMHMVHDNTSKDPISAIKYYFLLPLWWFFLTYGRHKGFMDSWQGFVFSFFSALRFPISFTKYLKK